MRAAARALACLVVLVCTCLWGQLETPPDTPPQTRPCAPAVAVAGVLVCGDPAAAGVQTLCGGPPPRSGATISLVDCAVGRLPGEQLLALGIPIDLNTGSLTELESLPNIGPTLARRIVAGRPFADVDELRRVAGIGPVRLGALRKHVTAGILASPSRVP